MVTKGYHRDRGPFCTGATCTANAVRVDGDISRYAVVDDVADVLYVETAGGNIGRNEALDLFRAERIHHSCARSLVVTTMKRFGGEGHALEASNQLIDIRAPVSKHQECVFRLRVLDQASQRKALVVLVDLHPVL